MQKASAKPNSPTQRSLRQSLSIAIIGAGPTGLALALLAAQKLPHVSITIYDARNLTVDLHTDPRVLALSYGSVQLLQRLQTWYPAKAQAITKVNVSQQQPSWVCNNQQVWITATEMATPMLGAVMAYGDILAPMQERWLEQADKEPQRLHTRFANPVKRLSNTPDGWVEVDADVAASYDLVVVAEGGIFSEQGRKTIVSDYQQKAWIGRATLQKPMNGIAYERFTSNGPAALLPLGEHEGALVWCQPTSNDGVEGLSTQQRLAVINTVFTPEVGAITALTELKHFELGLNAEKTLVQGRIVHIGNAAQTLHPVAGQGLNLGLRDVYMLAEQLALTPDIDQALKKMEYSRACDRWSVMSTTELLARGFTWDLPLLPELRQMALTTVQKISPLKRLLAKRMMYGWR